MWKVKVQVTRSCPLFATPWTIQFIEFSRLEYCSGQAFPSPGDLPNPGIKPRSLALQADSLPAKPPGKPKNTGVGSLSLLQWIFPTQELNWGLLLCRQILYQLSYQGSPYTCIWRYINICLWIYFCFIYKLICVIFWILHRSDIIRYLSFSDLLYLVWYSLGPSI